MGTGPSSHSSFVSSVNVCVFISCLFYDGALFLGNLCKHAASKLFDGIFSFKRI